MGFLPGLDLVCHGYVSAAGTAGKVVRLVGSSLEVSTSLVHCCLYVPRQAVQQACHILCCLPEGETVELAVSAEDLLPGCINFDTPQSVLLELRWSARGQALLLASERTPVDYSVNKLAQKQAVAKTTVLKCDAFTRHCQKHRRHLPLVSLLRRQAWRVEETCLQQLAEATKWEAAGYDKASEEFLSRIQMLSQALQGQEEEASALRSSLDVMEDSRDAALDDAAEQRLLAAQDSTELSAVKASLRAANKDAAASKEMIQALRPHISLTDRLANMEKQQPPTFKGASGNPCVEEQQRGESPHLEEKRMARGARGNVRRKGSQAGVHRAAEPSSSQGNGLMAVPHAAFVMPSQPSYPPPSVAFVNPMQPSFGGMGLPESSHLPPMQPVFGGVQVSESPHLASMQPSAGGVGLPESTHLAPMQPAFGDVPLPEMTCSSPSHLPSAAAPAGVPGFGLQPRQQLQPSFGTSPQDAAFPAWSGASSHQNSLFGSAVPLGPASQTTSAQPSFGFAAEPGNKGVVIGFTAKPGIVTFGQPAAQPQVSGASWATGTRDTALPQPWGVAPPPCWEDPDPDSSQALKAAMQRRQANEAVALSAVQAAASSTTPGPISPGWCSTPLQRPPTASNRASQVKKPFAFAAEPGNTGVVFGVPAKPDSTTVTFGQSAAPPQASGASLATGPIGTACPQPGGVPPSARWEDPDPDQALKAAIQRQKAEEAVTMFAIKAAGASKARGGATGGSRMDRIMAAHMRSLHQREAARTSAKSAEQLASSYFERIARAKPGAPAAGTPWNMVLCPFVDAQQGCGLMRQMQDAVLGTVGKGIGGPVLYGEYEQDGNWEPMVIKELPYVTQRECVEADKEVAALTAVKDAAHIQQLIGHYVHTDPHGQARMYILTKYIEGQTARQAFWWLFKQPGGEERVTQVANRVTHQLAQALEGLHKEGWAHVDLCSDNVILHFGDDLETVQATLIDLGGSILQHECNTLRLNTHPLSCAPELLAAASLPGRQFQQVDFMANDLWSLACLLVWMLTGSEAFDFLGEEADVVHEFEEDAEWAQERHELWASDYEAMTGSGSSSQLFPFDELSDLSVTSTHFDRLWSFICQLLHPKQDQRPTVQAAMKLPYLACVC